MVVEIKTLGEIMNFITIVLFAAGLGLLILGAEILVRGASRLATMIGIPPLIIGLTIVAFGTSSPEMAVSIQSVLSNQVDISLGNVVGSNIFNILFILGLSATMAPLAVSSQLVRVDVPIMIVISVLTLLFGIDHNISRLEGFFLFAGFIGYISFLAYKSRSQKRYVIKTSINDVGEKAKTTSKLLTNLGFIVIGLSLLVIGSRWLVNSAVAIAQNLGVSELLVGLTIVAVGTSLPEVATSVIASIRREQDIAVGNIIGSNIFNILAVLGLSCTLSSHGIGVSDKALQFDIPVMIVVAIACLPIFFTGHIIARWEGALFFGYYLVYTVYHVLESTSHKALPLFSLLMLVFAIPLTLVTLLIVTMRALRKKSKHSSE